ncbi:IS4 family transposase, partial [bacterium]|nr:IS4 family transposase [bacterium]
MDNDSIKTGKRHKKDPIQEKDLQGIKLIHKFIPLLERFHSIKDHHNRELYFDQYICLILLYFFNPILTSLRGIQQASHLEKVK